jgi:4a-hydroxytetrahydrobiopterin dehydratase
VPLALQTSLYKDDITSPLGEKEATTLLHQIPGWSIINNGCSLYKEYKFENAGKGIAFANKVSELAQQEGQKPDLRMLWENCKITIFSPQSLNLYIKDFIFAAKIDELYIEGWGWACTVSIQKQHIKP